MTYLQLLYAHLATVVPAFFLGTYLLFSRKGSPIHKQMGKVYLILMVITALITLLMTAKVGPTFLEHFGFIHLFSVLVLANVPTAFYAARAGHVIRHRNAMIGLYVGGIIIAGGFAFVPGRHLHNWLFG